ncbi:MAG: CBS domain-containing protein [Candidatus Hodarchaeales archaeon]|jgi:hypothetical protein
MLVCSVCGFENLLGSRHCANCSSDIVTEKQKPITDSRIEKAILTDKLKEVGGEKSIALQVSSDLPVIDAVRRMINEDKCSVVITSSEGSIKGIFTERSLLRRVCNEIPINVTKPIKEAMLASPVILKKDDSIAFALHTLAVEGYSYAIIKDEPIRVINIQDILQYIVELHPSLGGFDKVLNSFKTIALKDNAFNREDQDLLNQVSKNKNLFFRAFTASRKSGKLEETERISEEAFLNRFVPAIKEVIEERDEIFSSTETKQLTRLLSIFEQKKVNFLNI